MNKHILIIVLLISVLFGQHSHAQELEELFKEASENNPGLQAKYKMFEAALERIPQTNTLEDPVFSMGYFISPVETRVGPQMMRFSLSQMFPWFGTLKAQGDEAALMAEANFHAFIEARNKLFYEIASAYYPLYELEQWRRYEEDNLSILNSYKRIVSAKYENNEGTMVDILRLDIEIKDAKTRLSLLNKKKKPLTAKLNQLVNRDISKEIHIQDSLALLPETEPVLKDSILANNPVLKELKYKTEAGKAREIAAEKQGLPKLGVGLDYVIVNERPDITMPDNGKNILMPMVSFSIPVYRKKYKAAKREAQLLQESYELQREDYSNRLLADYEMIVFEVEQQIEFIELYNEQIETTEQSLNLLLRAYSNSGNDFEEVLRMQQKILTYKKLRAKALTEYHITLEKLNYLTAKERTNDTKE